MSSEYGVVDLDRDVIVSDIDDHHSAECSCGVRRTILRHNELSPCGGRALARLKAAHRDEYDRYLAELKGEALANFEVKWRRHLAGDHRSR
jgi:hypothetical protein